MLVGTDDCVCVGLVTISHAMPSIKPDRSGDRRVLFHCPSQTAKC